VVGDLNLRLAVNPSMGGSMAAFRAANGLRFRSPTTQTSGRAFRGLGHLDKFLPFFIHGVFFCFYMVVDWVWDCRYTVGKFIYGSKMVMSSENIIDSEYEARLKQQVRNLRWRLLHIDPPLFVGLVLLALIGLFFRR